MIHGSLTSSTAFFTFLRANLVLSPSAMSSANNTPQLQPSTTHVMSPSSPSPLANPPLVPLDDIPPLSLETLDSYDDKVEGLHLVADSVAQQRQHASRTLVSHPLCLATLAAALAAIYRLAYTPARDTGLALTLACGACMSYLAAIRYATAGYVALAERMGWAWLQRDASGGEDLILGARYGDDIIGALALRLEPNPAFAGKRRSRAVSLRGGTGVIRAWTTKLKYRGRGIGRDMLMAAVRVTKERCGRDAAVGFAKEHANSVMLLPSVFNGGFRRDEIRAAKALDEVLAEWEVSKKKR